MYGIDKEEETTQGGGSGQQRQEQLLHKQILIQDKHIIPCSLRGATRRIASRRGRGWSGRRSARDAALAFPGARRARPGRDGGRRRRPPRAGSPQSA